MEISKGNNYRSYWETAKLMDKESRAAFLEAIDSYMFDGIVPEDMPLLALVAFTAVKSFIDADVGRKAGGAPAGNQNARKQPQKQPQKQPEKQPKTNNVDVNVDEKEEENLFLDREKERSAAAQLFEDRRLEVSEDCYAAFDSLCAGEDKERFLDFLLARLGEDYERRNGTPWESNADKGRLVYWALCKSRSARRIMKIYLQHKQEASGEPYTCPECGGEVYRNGNRYVCIGCGRQFAQGFGAKAENEHKPLVLQV